MTTIIVGRGGSLDNGSRLVGGRQIGYRKIFAMNFELSKKYLFTTELFLITFKPIHSNPEVRNEYRNKSISQCIFIK